MSDEAINSPLALRPAIMPVPVSRVPMNVRTATMDDLPFMDELQKKYGKALGYFPRKQFEGYIAGGHVLVAESGGEGPVGYIISRDRYLKRDELGVVFQLCVVPGVQRKLVGASLLKAVFERAAYGCRLFCCWCAQDLPANEFWESMGFVPLAFRTGSDKKKRVHIFWQKRIVEGDVTTPWWYPFQTNGGAIRADRIVFPIPPNTHWRDVKAVELPGTENPALPVRRAKKLSAPEKPVVKTNGPGPGKVGILVGGRLKYVDRPGYVAPATEPMPMTDAPKPIAPKREKTPAPKIDPKYLAAARELRDRYLEHVNASEGAQLPAGKYDVSRKLGTKGESRQISSRVVRHCPALGSSEARVA